MTKKLIKSKFLDAILINEHIVVKIVNKLD